MPKRKNFDKRKPFDIISDTSYSNLEEMYIKFPGQELMPVSMNRKANTVEPNYKLIDKLQKKYPGNYTGIHTHPSGEGTPSPGDLMRFLGLVREKTSVIVPLDPKKDYVPKGYFVLKKKRSYDISKINKPELKDSLKSYRKIIQTGSLEEVASHLRDLGNKYHFSYRFLPLNGFQLSSKAKGFKDSRRIEMSLFPIFLGFFFIMFFGKFSLTGLGIFDLGTSSSRGFWQLGITMVIFLGLYVFTIWFDRFLFKRFIRKIFSKFG